MLDGVQKLICTLVAMTGWPSYIFTILLWGLAVWMMWVGLTRLLDQLQRDYYRADDPTPADIAKAFGLALVFLIVGAIVLSC